MPKAKEEKTLTQNLLDPNLDPEKDVPETSDNFEIPRVMESPAERLKKKVPQVDREKELEEHLNLAFQTGRYLVILTRLDPDGKIEMFRQTKNIPFQDVPEILRMINQDLASINKPEALGQKA